MLFREEMETIIIFDKSSAECTIFSADKSVMHKLDGRYLCIREDFCGGEISRTYRTNKKHISFRKDALFNPSPSKTAKRELTPEHLEKLQAARHKQQKSATTLSKKIEGCDKA